jgi:AraC-like DNA-binding protein
LREFHRVFRITPKQYLMRELFARALSELNNPGKTIKEIADAMDFSSEFNFSRFIKNYSGYSPSQLRKSGKGPLYVRK